jgi:hypothetical protein
VPPSLRISLNDIPRQVVARASAVPDNDIHAVKLHKNHVDMIKFATTSDVDYQSVLSHLQCVVSDVGKLSKTSAAEPNEGYNVSLNDQALELTFAYRF